MRPCSTPFFKLLGERDRLGRRLVAALATAELALRLAGRPELGDQPRLFQLRDRAGSLTA
jgi:hypothetical protein